MKKGKRETDDQSADNLRIIVDQEFISAEACNIRFSAMWTPTHREGSGMLNYGVSPLRSKQSAGWLAGWLAYKAGPDRVTVRRFAAKYREKRSSALVASFPCAVIRSVITGIPKNSNNIDVIIPRHPFVYMDYSGQVVEFSHTQIPVDYTFVGI
ncbi:hypothetical protein I7I51_08108 [Histoplasma capsulatum]|uniref:Uncharacterized protein n=1 Tax=Ajellomyces capsulatus TaxID=5037 RepID=A0A8A1LXR2_AJECA|nr:hypothetical protein I7I51_08108 [Histoplasma capsulatum]